MASLSERLEAAALTLAGSEPIKERLGKAWSKHLADLETRDFPRDVRDDFEQLGSALRRERALPGDTVLKASLRKLSNDDASRYASLIIRAYGQISALKSAPLQVVPRVTSPIAKFLALEERSVAG